MLNECRNNYLLISGHLPTHIHIYVYYNVIISIFLSCRIDYKLPKGRASSYFFSLSHTHWERLWHVMEAQENICWDESSSLLDPFPAFPVLPIFQTRKKGPEEFGEFLKLVKSKAMTLSTHTFLLQVLVLFFLLILVFLLIAYPHLELIYTEASSIMHMLWKVMFEILGFLICQMFRRKIYCSNYKMQMALWKLTNYVI